MPKRHPATPYWVMYHVLFIDKWRPYGFYETQEKAEAAMADNIKNSIGEPELMKIMLNTDELKKQQAQQEKQKKAKGVSHDR